MHLQNPESSLTDAEMAKIEQALGLKFPQPVRLTYLSSNGGCPEHYIFENDDIDTVVAKFLPLKSTSKGTAIDSYRQLVLKQALVSPQFFPFAIDAGGDYFFVDCSTQKGAVHFYRGDSAKGRQLVNLNLDFDGFWNSLTSQTS